MLWLVSAVPWTNQIEIWRQRCVQCIWHTDELPINWSASFDADSSVMQTKCVHTNWDCDSIKQRVLFVVIHCLWANLFAIPLRDDIELYQNQVRSSSSSMFAHNFARQMLTFSGTFELLSFVQMLQMWVCACKAFVFHLISSWFFLNSLPSILVFPWAFFNSKNKIWHWIEHRKVESFRFICYSYVRQTTHKVYKCCDGTFVTYFPDLHNFFGFLFSIQLEEIAQNHLFIFLFLYIINNNNNNNKQNDKFGIENVEFSTRTHSHIDIHFIILSMCAKLSCKQNVSRCKLVKTNLKREKPNTT